MRIATGFTLIELMIVLVILTVLLTMAFPAYQDSVLKSNRAAGRGILLDAAARQEQYFVGNKLYADTLDKLDYAVDESDAFYVDSSIEKSATAVADSIYKINVVRLSSITYSMTATPINRQAGDDLCKAFTLSSTGVKSSTGALTSTDCW